MKRLAALAAAILGLANPKRQPLTQCGSCNAWNEPSRTSCRNCGGAL